jgi:lipopolysaccharide-binding protein
MRKMELYIQYQWSDIIITLDGGASWFYQGLVDSFEGIIRVAIESAMKSKLMEGIQGFIPYCRTYPRKWELIILWH